MPEPTGPRFEENSTVDESAANEEPLAREARSATKESMTEEEKAHDDDIENAAGQLYAETMAGGDPKWSEAQQKFTSEDWAEARRRASEMLRSHAEKPDSRTAREARSTARESMTEEEKAHDDNIQDAAGQLFAEAMAAGEPKWNEAQQKFTSEDWTEARKRASEMLRGQ